MSSGTPAVDHNQLVNIFARFFGSILADLKRHDLRLKEQNDSRRQYKRESTVEFITHIR